jgi:hypothetical protein
MGRLTCAFAILLAPGLCAAEQLRKLEQQGATIAQTAEAQ